MTQPISPREDKAEEDTGTDTILALTRRSPAHRRRQQTAARGVSYVRFVLSTCDRLRVPLRWCGIDHPRMRALLEVQLLLDTRRSSALGQQLSGSSVIMTIVHGFIGFMFGLCLLIDDPVIGMGFALGGVMAMTTMVIMTEHIASLMDGTDASIVAPMPVDDRTVFAARVAHIVVFLTRTCLTLGAGSLVIGSFVYPPWVVIPVLLLGLALSSVLCLVGAFGGILLITRMFGESKAKTVVTYAQILVSVGFFAGVQVGPRLMNVMELADAEAASNWWLTLVPSCHFGGLLAVAEGAREPLALTLAGLAVAVPCLLTWLVVRVVTKGYVARVSAMATTHAEPDKPLSSSPRQSLFARHSGDPSRRAGYDFFRALSRRENQYRLRAYPSILMSVVIGAMASMPAGEFDATMACATLYTLAASTVVILELARFSENGPAAWLLAVGAEFHAGRFNSGSAWALLLTLMLPVALVIALLLLLLGGLEIVPHVLFALSCSAFVACVSARVVGREVPFTRPVPKKVFSEHTGPGMMMVGLVMVLAGAHFGLYFLGMEVWDSSACLYAGAVVMGLATWSTARGLRDLSPSRRFRP